MVNIRPFTKGDEESYTMVHNRGYSTETWYGTLERILRVEDVFDLSYDATFLAEVDGVVGLIDIKVRNRIGDIENLVVLPEYRGQGIGKALLERAIDFLKDKVEAIRVETPIQGENAIKFYLRNGFRHLTNAYLVKSLDKSKLEPYLGRGLRLVGDSIYWVRDREQMELMKKLKADFSVTGEFKVLTRTISD